MSIANISRFISDEKLGWLIRDLQELPESAQRAKQKAEGYTIPGEESLKYLEMEVMSEVFAELNDKGKPKFSNKEMRDAEVQRRLRDNAEYQQGRVEYEEAKKQKNELYTEVYLLRDKLKSQCALAGLLASLIKLEGDAKENTRCLQEKN